MDTYVQIVYVLAFYILHGLSVYPELTPSFHGSMARCLDFAPICFAPLCFVPPLFFPPCASSAVRGIVSSPHTLFQLYFVRSCYSWREHPAVSETSMRDSSSFLDSPLSPLWHLFASPFLLPTNCLLPTLSPSLYLPLFLGHVFLWPTGIFLPPLFLSHVRRVCVCVISALRFDDIMIYRNACTKVPRAWLLLSVIIDVVIS